MSLLLCMFPSLSDCNCLCKSTSTRWKSVASIGLFLFLDLPVLLSEPTMINGAVSPEPSLLAHTSSESRGTFRQKARSLAPLNGWACAVKICHDGLLEDTNSLDGAQMIKFYLISLIWAASSEFVSSSIPSWQILTAHAQPFRGARDLAFCLKVPLDSLLIWASSEGSGETARMRRLAWTFAARIGYKYQIRLTRSIWFLWHWIQNKFVKFDKN